MGILGNNYLLGDIINPTNVPKKTPTVLIFVSHRNIRYILK